MTAPQSGQHSGRLRRLRQRIVTVCVVMMLVGAAWLSVVFDTHFDLTHGSRATLSAPSLTLLETLDGPLEIKVFAAPNRRQRQSAANLLERYIRFKSDLQVSYKNPAQVPAELRELDVNDEGDMVVSYRGRTRLVTKHTEAALSSALAHLARSEERWLAFVTGHGERDFLGLANHDLGEFGIHLTSIGIKPQPLTLTSVGDIPTNTAVLVISTPEVALLGSEIEHIKRYVREGGNLLWLAEPNARVSLDWLATELDLSFVPGVIVDPNTTVMGINQATIVVLTDYQPHTITTSFELVTLLPETVGLEISNAAAWQTAPLAFSSPDAWAESDLSSGVASFDDGDRRGPLLIAVALERERASPTGPGRQRIVVVGDGDFLSNTYLGNAGNLEFGTAIINWLSHDDALISIPVRNAPDQRLVLSRLDALVIGVGSLFALPGGLALTGVVVWWRRRRR